MALGRTKSMSNCEQSPTWPHLECELSDRYLSELRNLIPEGSQIALIDFPDHSNVGDSAIWVGELIALKRLRCSIVYVSSYRSYKESILRSRLAPGSTVLIHGGGNFGTIWPECQAHREDVFASLKDYRLVQLPQSIFFGNEASLQHCRHLLSTHPAATLLVRDRPSFEIANSRLRATTSLCPDAAFCLEGHLVREAPRIDALVLARTDRERASVELGEALRSSGLQYKVVDWVEEQQTPLLRLSAMLWRRAHGRLTKVPGFFAVLFEVWRRCAWQRVRRGAHLLSQGRVVITDRLHAHILCTLLRIPHVVLDNHYGKVGGFIDAWTAASPLVHRAASAQEAVTIARQLLTDLDRSVATA